MSRILFFLSSIFILSLSFGQKNSGLRFDISDFNEKAKTAEWLYEYDAIAWWTSDSVMKGTSIEKSRLGSEWFCFKNEKGLWHAVYGKFADDDFDLVFHYTVDSNYRVSRSYEKADTAILNGHSRALQTANMHIKPHTDSVKIRLNQYIRQNPDGTYNVWILSAFQPNGWAVHGKEFILLIDKSGTKILKDNSHYLTDFRGFEVNEPRKIWIDQTNLEKPTLGAVFFVWYYKKYFTNIYIDNKYYYTTTFKHEGGQFSWIHMDKDLKKESKRSLKSLFKRKRN